MAILPIAVEQPTTISHDDKRHEKTQEAFLVQPGQEDFFEERRRGRWPDQVEPGAAIDLRVVVERDQAIARDAASMEGSIEI
jgi:hypothetical protein